MRCLLFFLCAACQDLLAQHPACCGWVRRKTVLSSVGEKIETRLKIGRSVSLVNKIPCELLSDAFILHVNIYNATETLCPGCGSVGLAVI